MPYLECFFDCSSPWTYLGFHNIQPMAADLGVEITWRPILVGGLFNTINPSVYANRKNPVPAKQQYMQKDLQDWAHYSGIKIHWPKSIFPINSVKAMRGCIAAGRQGKLVQYARRVLEADWELDKDKTKDELLAEIARASGLDPKKMYAEMCLDEIKAELKANGIDLAHRGGYGSPTFFVGGNDMYFGNDRIPLVHSTLRALLKA